MEIRPYSCLMERGHTATPMVLIWLVGLFNFYGGHLDTYNSYSWACINVATPTVYGTKITGNQRQDWVN